MKSSRALALFLLLACLPVTHAQEAQDRPPFLGGYLRESRVLYPLEVGAWQAEGEKRYEPAEAGASVRYRHKGHADRWMDLYFYPSGTLMDAQFAQVVDSEAREIVKAHRSAGHAAEQATPLRTFDAPGEYDRLLGDLAVKPRSVAFSVQQDGKRYHSLLAMTVRGMYFIKVRFSVEADALPIEQVRDEGEAFLRGFAGAVRILNTGDCWKVLDIAPLPVGGKPEELLASANEGTAEEVWVGEDRLFVATVDRAGPAHAAAVALGADLHAAIRGRCVAPEAINPDVPADMREIRFEYGTPDGPPRPAADRRMPTRT